MNKKEFIKRLIDMGGCGAKPKTWDRGWDEAISEIIGIAEELDEPEALSQEWIDENKVARINNLRKMTISDVVPVGKLENLLVPKQDKPVIPRFVADWIEASRHAMYHLLGAIYDRAYSEDMKEWLFKGDKRTRQDNQDKLARAWLDGYEVEKEQKYYVLDNHGKTILVKLFGKQIAPSQGRCVNDLGKHNSDYQFTEQEIKNYDERYWAFAQEVTP